MTVFLPDTNVWLKVGRDEALTQKFDKALAAGDKFVIGPPALIELVRGMVRYGQAFATDQLTYAWMRDHGCEVLELPKPFMAKILHTTLPGASGVTPQHYGQLIDEVVHSADLNEFNHRCNANHSVWGQIDSIDRIHEAQIEQELKALEDLATRRKLDLLRTMSMWFGAPGCRPKPFIMASKFSAALEYLDSSIQKVVRGAKPRKNDRGLYVDFQMLMYLADPEIKFLTNENFSGEIRNSPQKNRIVTPDIAL
jgi:hypothetical protein